MARRQSAVRYPRGCRHVLGGGYIVSLGSLFPVVFSFPADFCHSLPGCKLPAGFVHVNVYPSGTVPIETLAYGDYRTLDDSFCKSLRDHFVAI